MSEAIPYTVEIRDVKPPPGEHEVVFTSGTGNFTSGMVVRLTTDELVSLREAVNKRLSSPTVQGWPG